MKDKNMTVGIPGFEMFDETGRKIADNPKMAHAKGRRVYDIEGRRIWAQSKVQRTRAKYHEYLLRIPKGAWKAFTMKCERNGVTRVDAIRVLMKLWVNGTLDFDIRLHLDDD